MKCRARSPAVAMYGTSVKSIKMFFVPASKAFFASASISWFEVTGPLMRKMVTGTRPCSCETVISMACSSSERIDGRLLIGVDFKELVDPGHLQRPLDFGLGVE